MFVQGDVILCYHKTILVTGVFVYTSATSLCLGHCIDITYNQPMLNQLYSVQQQDENSTSIANITEFHNSENASLFFKY